MKKNIILAGVGGQGILSIAYVIDNAALDAGCQFKQAEVHGMAQRGGAVQSHLRYSDSEIHSDLVPAGCAQLILSVEPLEVMRYWHYLEPGGWVVTSVTPYVNIPDYPDTDQVLADLAGFDNLILVDTAQLARAAGNLRAQNMVALGAAAPLLDFTPEQLLVHVESLFAAKGEKIVAVNQKAFRFGVAVGGFFKGLIEAGVPAVSALELCRKLDPETIEPDRAAAWAEAIGADGTKLQQVLAVEGLVACDQIATSV
jgi:indolepyruvate ferredoxin oxidoreductase beta subunit